MSWDPCEGGDLDNWGIARYSFQCRAHEGVWLKIEEMLGKLLARVVGVESPRVHISVQGQMLLPVNVFFNVLCLRGNMGY